MEERILLAKTANAFMLADNQPASPPPSPQDQSCSSKQKSKETKGQSVGSIKEPPKKEVLSMCDVSTPPNMPRLVILGMKITTYS